MNAIVAQLLVPGVEVFGRHTKSTLEEQDRYVITGGFVTVEELSKKYAVSKSKKLSQQRDLFSHVSPRARSSHTSSVSGDCELQGWESIPTSPSRSESWSSPETPRTPFAGTKQTVYPFTPYANNVASPRLSNYNRYVHDLYSNASPTPSNSYGKDYESCSQNIATPARDDKSLPVQAPIELAGSLLLPSQGFPQSNPPEIPPHLNARSHSAPVILCLSRSPTESSDSLKFSRNIHERESNMTLFQPVSTSNVSEPKRPVRGAVISHPATASDSDTQGTLPVRKSSLRSKPAMPRHRPPPTPLSQMSLEELMQVLPSLDAAIVAHDWVPCMQKRHKELKHLLETVHRPTPEDKLHQPFNEVSWNQSCTPLQMLTLSRRNWERSWTNRKMWQERITSCSTSQRIFRTLTYRRRMPRLMRLTHELQKQGSSLPALSRSIQKSVKPTNEICKNTKM